MVVTWGIRIIIEGFPRDWYERAIQEELAKSNAKLIAVLLTRLASQLLYMHVTVTNVLVVTFQYFRAPSSISPTPMSTSSSVPAWVPNHHASQAALEVCPIRPEILYKEFLSQAHGDTARKSS